MDNRVHFVYPVSSLEENATKSQELFGDYTGEEEDVRNLLQYDESFWSMMIILDKCIKTKVSSGHNLSSVDPYRHGAFEM